MRLFLLFCLAFMCQEEPRIISLKDYYIPDSVIFGSNTDFPFNVNNYKEAFTPSINDVMDAENYLFKNYYQYNSKINQHFNLKNKICSKYKKSHKVKNKLNKYRRQYLGYINNEGDKIIDIILIEVEKENWNKDEWKKKIMFKPNSDYYLINLTKNKFVYRVNGMDEDGNSKN